MHSNCLSQAEAQAGSTSLLHHGLGSQRLALGTAGIGGLWTRGNTEGSVEALLYALERGLTVWDTAPAYDSAELRIGEALRQWRGPLPIISTKVGKTFPRTEPAIAYQPDTMRESLERSLERMGLERIDLLFLHEPEKMEAAQRGPALETLLTFKQEGLVRHLGLGGGWGSAWDGFIESGAFTAVISFLALDACCLDSMPQDVPRLKRANMAIYGGSPLHMGLLAHRDPARAPWARPHALEGLGRLEAIADELGMSTVELSHRFVYSMRAIDRVLIGPKNLAELQASLADFEKGVLDTETFHRIYDANLAQATPRYAS